MASKRTVASKKQKTTAGTSRTQQSYDQTRFLGQQNEERYHELADRTIWYERIFNLNPQGDCGALTEAWTDRKWEKLLDPHRKINTEALREFYANALPIEGERYPFKTKVGGRSIDFSRDAISEFLGHPLVLREGQRCRFQESINAIPDDEK